MNVEGLLPRQIEPAKKLVSDLRFSNGVLDGSDLGTGKTYQVGAVIREFDVPTLVVCPSIAQTGWRRMGAHLKTEFEIVGYEKARTGNTPFGWWENPALVKRKTKLVCNVCQCEVTDNPCHLHRLGIHCVDVKTVPHDYGKFFWHENIQLLVFDEIHRCSALDSLQADMLIAAGRQRIKTVGLSATIADSPLHLRAFGFVLGLHRLGGNFYQWARSKGCQKLPFGGFHFAVGGVRKKEILSELHTEIFTRRGVRVRIADLGDQFPACQITAELYDLEAAGRVDELYKKMEAAIEGLRVDFSKHKESPLSVFLSARAEVELLKVPIFEEIYDDAIAQGKHVAIFVNFRRTVDELCKRLKLDCRVDGSQVGAKGAAVRQKHVDDFLHDRSPGIVLTSAAGSASIGLQDIYGNFPRLGLVSLGTSARDVRQIFGRLPREGGKSKSMYRVILISGTDEEKIHKKVSGKLDCLDTLNDSDLLSGSNLPLTNYVPGGID